MSKRVTVLDYGSGNLRSAQRALQRVGALLEQAARRPLDMGVRLGGEEFALILPGHAEPQALVEQFR